MTKDIAKEEGFLQPEKHASLDCLEANEQMELSIIIVNFNVKEFLEQSITSIKKACRNIAAEIIVVDNASSDGSVALIRQKFPEVKLIANAENVGFARANNQAIAQAQGEYILLINPDTIVQEDTFRVILDFFAGHPECGMVGCKILNPDGSLQLPCRRSFPTPWVAFAKISGLSRLFPRSKIFGRYNLTYLDPDETYEVEAISGSFMFFRAKVVKTIGLLDESFFMYGEDLDWCYRIRQAGWKIYYLPTTKIIHFKGESSKNSDVDLTLQFYRAMKLFVEKHYHHRYWHVPQWFLMLGIWLRATLSFAARFFRRMAPGIVDYGLIQLAMLLAIQIRFGTVGRHLHAYWVVMLVYSLIWMISLATAGAYGRRKYSAFRAFYGVLVGLVMNTSLTFFFNQYAFSRAVVLIAGTLNVLFLAGWRIAIKVLSRLPFASMKHFPGKSLLGRRALIVAPIASGLKIADKLRTRIDAGYEVCGIIAPDGASAAMTNGSIPIWGNLQYFDAIVRQTRAQEIIFSTEQISYDQILQIIAHSRRKALNFKMIPSSMDVIIGKASLDYIGDLPLMDIEYQLHRPINIVMKRLLDIGISLVMLIVAIPELLYLRWIKHAQLQPQDISGANGNRLKIAQLVGPKLTERQRRLPYWWYILKGQLSLVGSDIVAFDGQNPSQSGLSLKPGLTGLYQVNRMSSSVENNRTSYELYYAKNYSLLLDLEIIIRTFLKI